MSARPWAKANARVRSNKAGLVEDSRQTNPESRVMVMKVMGDQDLYTIGEVAAILGVSPHTIRAWERRHGIVKPLRTRSRQRRYRGEDVELLQEVKRAIDMNGMSLRLAFRAVSGHQQLAESRTSRSQSHKAPLFSTTGGIWRAVADVLTELIIVVNLDGEIVEANVATAKAFGVTRQRLSGRSLPDLVDSFDRAKAVLLYRPQPLTVSKWELNLATHFGSRLYSFESWPVSAGDDRSLALIGTEMFPSLTLDTAAPPDSEAAAHVQQVTSGSFQSLVDNLPYGLAVTTVGREPRIVYANHRLQQTLGQGLAFTGQLLSELVANPAVLNTLRHVVTTGSGKTLRVVPEGGPFEAKYLHIALRPLFSSARRVTSVLILVHDETAEVSWRSQLQELLADQRIERANTVEELAQLALQYLTALAPRVDFVIAIAAPPDSRGAPYAVTSTPSWRAMAGGHYGSRVGTVIQESAASGKRSEVDYTEGRVRFHLTAVPLRAVGGHRRRLGAVAWRRPTQHPLLGDLKTAIEAFLGRLAFAGELVQVRSEAARTASQLETVVAAASVVPLSGGRTGLGARFLERLVRALNADRAAIGRVLGPQFVVEAAYSQQGEGSKPGDRLRVARHIVESVRSGEPTGRSGPSPGRSRKAAKRGSQTMHELAVPLVLDRQVMAVVTLARTGDLPFDADDVRLVQTLSSVGLLAVSLARRDSSTG